MTANDTSTIETTEAVNPDEGLRQGLFEAQAARIVELQAEIASRQEEVDDLKARILDSHPAGTYQAGNLKVQVKPGRAASTPARSRKPIRPPSIPEPTSCGRARSVSWRGC